MDAGPWPAGQEARETIPRSAGDDAGILYKTAMSTEDDRVYWANAGAMRLAQIGPRGGPCHALRRRPPKCEFPSKLTIDCPPPAFGMLAAVVTSGTHRQHGTPPLLKSRPLPNPCLPTSESAT